MTKTSRQTLQRNIYYRKAKVSLDIDAQWSLVDLYVPFLHLILTYIPKMPYEDVNRRTIEIPQCTHILRLKVAIANFGIRFTLAALSPST